VIEQTLRKNNISHFMKLGSLRQKLFSMHSFDQRPSAAAVVLERQEVSFKSLAVFCSCSDKLERANYDAAAAVGHIIGTKGIDLVYGGGSMGMMGAVASACKKAGGKVIGVSTKQFMLPEMGRSKEDEELESELLVADSMLERKKLMSEKCDGVVVLPGGLGTLEEIFYVLVNYEMPVIVLNLNGHYDALNDLLKCSVEQGFIGSEVFNRIRFETEPDQLLDPDEDSYLATASSAWTMPPMQLDDRV